MRSSGFCFEEAPGVILEQVFRCYDGKWSVYSDDDGDRRIFDDLTENRFSLRRISHYRQQSIESESRYRAAAIERVTPDRELTSADLLA
jgi:hypothetical protein